MCCLNDPSLSKPAYEFYLIPFAKSWNKVFCLFLMAIKRKDYLILNGYEKLRFSKHFQQSAIYENPFVFDPSAIYIYNPFPFLTILPPPIYNRLQLSDHLPITNVYNNNLTTPSQYRDVAVKRAGYHPLFWSE